MADEIIDYKTLDINKIHYEPPKKIKGGSYLSDIKYNKDGELIPLIIQTPRLVSRDGIVKNDLRTILALDFDKSHSRFYDFILDIDDNNISKVETNSEDWFRQKFPLDVVEEFYKSAIVLGRGKNPPKLKLKIPNIKGKLECLIYNKNREKISYEDIKNNNHIVCVLRLSGLRFLRQQVICEWIPIQLMVDTDISNSKYIINDSLLSDNDEPEETHLEDNIDSVLDPPILNETIENIENIENIETIETIENSQLQKEKSKDLIESESFIDNVIDIASDNEDETNEVENTELENTEVENTEVENTEVENTEVENTEVENTEVENTEVDTNELNYKELYETSQGIILELNNKIEHLEFENKNNLSIIEKFKSLLNN